VTPLLCVKPPADRVIIEESHELSLSSLTPPSEMEAKFYYAGLPSGPALVARTGTPWKAPTGPEAYRRIRELRAVGNHALTEVWEGNLDLKIPSLRGLAPTSSASGTPGSLPPPSSSGSA
jgi:hypothetical protein